jgi:hypothetical protein
MANSVKSETKYWREAACPLMVYSASLVTADRP